MSYGQNAKVAAAPQTAFGTAVTAVGSFYHLPIVTGNVGLDRPELLAANISGRFEENQSYDGGRQVNGTLSYEPMPKALGLFLISGVNSPTVTSSGSVRGYRFTPRASDFSTLCAGHPLTIWQQFDGVTSGDGFYDCVVSQLSFTIRAGELVRSEAQVVGGKVTSGGVGSFGLTYENARTAWPWNTASIWLGSSGDIDFTEVTVTLLENIEGKWTIDGQLYPNRVKRNDARQVRVSGRVKYTDRFDSNAFQAGTQRRMGIFLRGDTAIQSGYFNEFYIDIPQFKLTEFKPPIDGPGEIEVPFQGRGALDTTSNYSIEFWLQNTWAGYLG